MLRARRAKRITTAALVGLVVLAGVLGLAQATRWSVGLKPDSTSYVAVARSLVAGDGFAVPGSDGALHPMTRFPPLYPAVLAAFGCVTGDLIGAARSLNLLLFAWNIVLVALLVARYAGGASGAVVAGAALFASSPDMMRIHALALSEPLFIALGFAGLLLLAAHLRSPHRAALVGAAALAGLAFLTRYVGGALVLAGIVVLLLPADRSWRRRGADAAVFGALATLPMAIWLLRSLAVSGSAAGRHLAFHPVEGDHVALALRTMASWVPIQGGWSSLPWLAALGLVAVLALRTPREARAHTRRYRTLSPLPRVLLVFLLVYMASLLVSISFFDAGTQPTWRILAPVFVAGLVLTLCGALRLLRARPSAALAILLGFLALAVAASYTRTTAEWVRVRALEGGEGYGLRRWQESELIARVKGLPEDVAVYTNAPDAVYMLAGRFSANVPARVIAGTRRPNPDYAERLEAMEIAVRENHALLVWFDWISWRWYLPSMTQLARQLPIRRSAKVAEGEIWEYDPARDRPE